jgi:hypothetical protein
VFVRDTSDHAAYFHFRHLQTASEKSRYDVQSWKWENVDQLCKKHLEPFKRALAKHGLDTG